MVIYQEDQYRKMHATTPIGVSVLQTKQTLDMAVEAIASHLTGPHAKHRLGLARLYKIIQA